VWGEPGDGGTNAPDGKGYTKIYSNTYAFAALKADGSIKAWSDSRFGGPDAPAGSGYTKIYSTSTPEPPNLESPHALIEPSTLRVAKACSVE
jgi:hypothetical protein